MPVLDDAAWLPASYCLVHRVATPATPTARRMFRSHSVAAVREPQFSVAAQHLERVARLRIRRKVAVDRALHLRVPLLPFTWLGLVAWRSKNRTSRTPGGRRAPSPSPRSPSCPMGGTRSSMRSTATTSAPRTARRPQTRRRRPPAAPLITTSAGQGARHKSGMPPDVPVRATTSHPKTGRATSFGHGLGMAVVPGRTTTAAPGEAGRARDRREPARARSL
jgi:hypothetical protein